MQNLRQTLLRPTLQSLSSRGLAPTLRSLLHRLGLPLAAAPLDPYPAQAPPSIHPFDLAHAVDTSGYLRADHLHTPANTPTPLHGSALWSTAYYAIAPSLFDQSLRLLTQALTPTSLHNFTFLDLGCGKGRALLLASLHPFHQILGVELDPALAATAHRNLQTFHHPAQLCRDLRVLHADATDPTLFDRLAPSAPTVLFLYHPFLAPVLRRVLHNLTRSLARHPRDLWLLYLNPEPLATLRHFPALHLHTRTLLHITPEDDLPDRFGFRSEELAIFHHHPH